MSKSKWFDHVHDGGRRNDDAACFVTGLHYDPVPKEVQMVEITHDQIRAVMVKHRLCSNGRVYTDRQGVTNGEVGEYYGDRFLGEVAFAVKRLSALPRVSNVSDRSPGSYSLKHVVERSWTPEDKEIDHGYVCNGALLVAAHLLGLPMRYGPHDGPNASIGLSRNWFDQMRRAQDAARKICQS